MLDPKQVLFAITLIVPFVGAVHEKSTAIVEVPCPEVIVAPVETVHV